MPMIMDVSQIMISNLMVMWMHGEKELNEDILRHMILNSIRSNRRKHMATFGGDLVLACDSGTSWRRKVFPYYKANRRKLREKSDMPWEDIHAYLKRLRGELKENLPYPVIWVEDAEGDDVIATILNNSWKPSQKHNDRPLLIISGDEDFVQLHNDYVQQWNPVMKKWVTADNSQYDEPLLTHILQGDTSDGIPNVLSDDDTFVTEGKRQKPLTHKKYMWLTDTPRTELPLNIQENMNRNSLLIDLTKTPPLIQEKILNEYVAESKKDRRKLIPYFMEKNLSNLMQNITDF